MADREEGIELQPPPPLPPLRTSESSSSVQTLDDGEMKIHDSNDDKKSEGINIKMSTVNPFFHAKSHLPLELKHHLNEKNHIFTFDKILKSLT